MTPDRSRGFVLARQERGEADLVATLLLDDGQLVRAVANGGARPSRRFGAGLSPFTLYGFRFGRASAQRQRLEEARVERAYPGVLADLRRTAAAGAVSVVARDLGVGAALDTTLYDLYALALERLECADALAAGALVVQFAFVAFDRAGHPIVLDACVRCGRTVPSNALVRLSPEAGGVVCAACGGGPFALRAAERRALCEVIAGAAAGFRATMFQWTARLVAPHAQQGGETIARLAPHWDSHA